MKSSFRFRSSTFFLAILLAAFSGSPARSQSPEPAAQSAPASSQAQPEVPGAKAEHAEQAAEKNETDEYRHSAVVKSFANFLHLPVETAAKIFQFINFAILAGSVLYFVFKLLPKAIRTRGETIKKNLSDARTATEQANERLSGVEQRLARLDEEIDKIRKQVEQDAETDSLRIKQSLEEEKRRIIDAAGQEIESVGAAAQRDLRKFAAELAIDRATGKLSLTPEIDRRLVGSFASEIGKDFTKGGRN